MGGFHVSMGAVDCCEDTAFDEDWPLDFLDSRCQAPALNGIADAAAAAIIFRRETRFWPVAGSTSIPTLRLAGSIERSVVSQTQANIG